MIPTPMEARKSGGSTAAVLWLMITIVFLPIAAAHGIARFTAPAEAPAVQAAVAGVTRPGS